MTSGFTFRLATPEDAETLSAIASRTFHSFATTTLEGDIPDEELTTYIANKYPADKMLADIQDPNIISGFVFPKEDPVNPCGYVMMFDCSFRPGDEGHGNAQDHLEIRRVYVDVAFHGKGAAYVLMDNAMELAKQRKRKIVWLMAARRNLRAKKFYRKYGFDYTSDYGLVVGNTVVPYEVFTLQA